VDSSKLWNEGQQINDEWFFQKNLYNCLKKTVKSLQNSEIDIMFSGTTLNCIHLNDKELFICNVGDSKSIMASGNNFSQIIPLSVEHKPENNLEKKWIFSKQGRI